MSRAVRPAGRPRALLTVAAVAVAFAAADTYVVVLALPEMMGSAGIPIERLQRAAPIVSGFLLGYVAMLPLIGRIADLRGRVPVLVASLVLFSLGSLVTALAYDLPSMVAGRFVQGVGAGGLVPATLALVADLYPAERRALPLGLVSAVQEIGSVLGPLLGALALAVADWRTIFLINLGAGLVLAAALRAPGLGTSAPGGSAASRRVSRFPDVLGVVLLLVALASFALLAVRPAAMVRDLEWGALFVPFTGSGRWLTPLGALVVVAAAGLVVRCLTARRPLVDLRGWLRAARDADLTGSLLLAVALGGIVLAFATADPAVQVFAAGGWWCLGASALAGVALAVHLRRVERPLVPPGTLRRTASWGALAVSLFVGAALGAALVDIPLFARTTVHRDSQLDAALVLLRFLLALPVGAVLGGLLTRRLPAGSVTAAGMAGSAVGFWRMSGWDAESLTQLSSNGPLVLAGLGFGLALAPVSAVVLASTDAAVHGLASALVVVARMTGMLVGISVLTAIGLRRYHAAQAGIGSVEEVCGRPRLCAAYEDLQLAAAIAQEQTVFAGAGACALLAAVLAVVLFRGAPTRDVPGAEALRSAV